MNRVYFREVTDAIENDQQQTNEEKRIQEKLEKQLLEKQQNDRLLEQLARENAQVVKHLFLEDQTHPGTRRALPDTASIHTATQTQLQKYTIQNLIKSIETSILSKLNEQSKAKHNTANTQKAQKQPANPTKQVPIIPTQPKVGAQYTSPKESINTIKNKLKKKELKPNDLIQMHIASVFDLNPNLEPKHPLTPGNSNTPSLDTLDMLELGASESDLDSLKKISETIIQETLLQSMKTTLKQLVIQSLLSAINQTTVSDGLGAKANEASYVSIINSLKSSRKLGHSDTINELHHTILAEAKDEVRDILRTIARRNHSESGSDNNSNKSHDSDTINSDFVLKRATEMGVLSSDAAKALTKSAPDVSHQDSVTIDLFDLGHMLLEFGHSDSSNTSSNQSHPYQYTENDEHNIVLDRIRANLMQLAVSGSFVSGLIAKVKLMIHKRAGMKLGIYNQEIEDRLSTEAKQRATTHLQAMLDEALLERASFHSECGTDWENNATKIKSVIRNLNRLGVSVDTNELSERIAHANRAMWPIVELEIASIHTLIAESDFPIHIQQALSDRLAQIKRVQTRIESVEPTSVTTETIPADQYRSICANV